ncbi:MAG: hypothetical protein K2N96_03835 [Muribaculaceae bacterium]|nr:hypothetical protein [Muribaculaceae bacterium]
MKKIFLSFLMMVALSVQAQDIALITPETGKGCNVMQAFTHLKSKSKRNLHLQAPYFLRLQG